jgi:S1-C subfamily serine protease
MRFQVVGACPLAVVLSVLAASPPSSPADDAEAGVAKSVVKILVTKRGPELERPWLRESPQEVSGTGSVIEGKRILTNAHVVNYASRIFVQSDQLAEKSAATVEVYAPEMDLAILKLEDETLFDGSPPLPRSKALPEVRRAVTAYGFPVGGTNLSITRGIVSRIDWSYFSTRVFGLRIQIDAAINPGNSGGPVTVDGSMIGVAFSGLNDADNIAYLIPVEEIELFLKDVADGTYDGKPGLFDELQDLQNPALRERYKLGAAGGMVVRKARQGGDYPLKVDDVITAIAGREIDNSGLVRIRSGLRLDFRSLVQSTERDGLVDLTIIRDGRRLEVKVPTRERYLRVIPRLKGKYPGYFIFGPMVFTSASTEYLERLDQNGWATYLENRLSPLSSRRGDVPHFEGEEIVVVPCPMINRAETKGYTHEIQSQVVDSVDGVKVRNLRHLVEVLRDGTDPFVVFRFAEQDVEDIVFRRSEILASTPDVLAEINARGQGSDELMAVWKKK